MTGYRKIDMTTWPRREHYRYYTEKLKIECNMTVPIDVKKLLDFCHESGHKFYPSLIYLVTKVLNQMENFRMFQDAEGNLCVWDQVVPNYTIFHEDDKTFSDCWTEYSDVLRSFTGKSRRIWKKGRRKKASRPKQVSQLIFTAFPVCHGPHLQHLAAEPQVAQNLAYFPIITMGKYEKSGEKILMPVNMMIAHAVADGYHAGMFFQKLQEAIDEGGFIRT